MRKDKEKLLDILESITKIQDKLPINKEYFYEDELLQVWILYHLQIIGEASSKLSNTIKTKYSHIPWQDIA